MRYFPLFYQLTNKPVLVVGGGDVASRKVEALCKANAMVTIISPTLSEELQQRVKQKECVWMQQEYTKGSITNHYVQVWATTNNSTLNHQIYDDAKARHIMVNVVDDLPYCDFITPAMVNRGQVQIAISSGGASPVLIRNIRRQIESLLPQNTALLSRFAEKKRTRIKQYKPSIDERRIFWEQFFALSEVKGAETESELMASFEQLLTQKVERKLHYSFIVYGDDIELLSIKALRTMQQAEHIAIHVDAPEALLDYCRRDASRSTFQLDNLAKQASLNDLIQSVPTLSETYMYVMLIKEESIKSLSLEECENSHHISVFRAHD
ncbi:siroheme synthase [Vibrio sp.]|nr:siroheme synthase [Vibrio sp.]